MEGTTDNKVFAIARFWCYTSM